MGYITRQEFRDALLALYKELHERTKTKRHPSEGQKANENPVELATITKLHLISSIETRKPETDKRDESNYHFRSLLVQWFTFGAVVIYATIAALQWCQMKGANDLAQKANADAWMLANRANRTAINSERPWIGATLGTKDWEIPKVPIAVIYFINSGHRPAKVTRVCFDKGDYQVFPDSPPCHAHKTDIASTVLIVPNGTVTNTQPEEQFTQARSDYLGLRQKTFYIYASIDYEDVLTHAKHWTHACWQYFPGFHNEGNGFVNCSVYNEVDPETPEQ